MGALNIDSILFVGFLIVNLFFGLWYGRGVKNITDYALGGRSFSTGALVSTIVATLVTGSGFFIALSKTYSDGLHYTIAATSESISIIITALFIVPKMAEFLGSLSVAEIMGKLYGKKVRFITAICGIIWMAGSIAVEFKIFGNLFNYFLGIDHTIAVVMAASVVILYSSLGGIRSVTHTDVLQFLTFGFVVPCIAVIIWSDAQSSNITFSSIVSNPKFDLGAIFSFHNPDLPSLIFLILYFSVPIIGPLEFQRISMGSSISQSKRAFLIAAVIYALINILFGWVPTLIAALTPGLESDQIVSYLINNYTYTGLKGFLIIGVSAMVMSSSDSFINTSSVLFGYDLKDVFNIKVDNLVLSRIFALGVGAIAVYLALSTDDLLDMIMTAASYYMPVVTVPLVLSIIGFRSSTTSVLIAMGSGFFTVIFWDYFDIEIEVVIPAMVINLIALFASHYLLRQPGGWIKSEDAKTWGSIFTEYKEEFLEFVKLFSITNILNFCKKTAPKNELTYVGFGVYCIFYTFSTMYSTRVALMQENNSIILIIYQIMLVTGVITGIYPIWPDRFKKESVMQVLWNVMVFYMLVLFSSFFVLLSGLGQLQFGLFTLNILMTAILVGWKLSLGMMVVGFYMSIQFYKHYAGIDTLDFTVGSPQFILMYALTLIGSALIIFLKPKQEYIEETEHKVEVLQTEVIDLSHDVNDLNEKVIHYSQRAEDHSKEIERLGSTAQKILNNVNHELRLPIGNVMNFSDMLYEALQKSSDKLVQELAKEVYDNSNRVSTMILNMLDLATLDVKKVNLQKKMINFSELVEDRVKNCSKVYLRGKKINFELDIQPNILMALDPDYIRQTVDNLTINAINFSQTGLIKVVVAKQEDEVILSITDQGAGIPQAELFDIFTPFKMGSNTESKASGRGIGLALCKSSVEAHGGDIIAESDGCSGATFTVRLPFPK